MPHKGSDTLVLLATFNGASHLAEQLESIKAQTHQVDVWVSDDGSSDDSLKIAKLFDNVTVIRQNGENTALGHNGNFGWLATQALASSYDYFYFCDQDDIWLPDKVEKLNAVLASVEKDSGKSKPVLVHSDLTVVNAVGDTIAPSFIDYQGLPEPSSHGFPEFLYQNVVTGCATAFNKALLSKATPLPECAVVHDFWFALVAHTCGNIVFVPESLVLYRQHAKNSIGALSAKQQMSLLKSYYYRALLKFPKHINDCVLQAQELRERYPECIPAEKLDYIEKFSELKNTTLKRKWAAIPLFFPQYSGWKARLFLRWVLTKIH